MRCDAFGGDGQIAVDLATHGRLVSGTRRVVDKGAEAGILEMMQNTAAFEKYHAVLWTSSPS